VELRTLGTTGVTVSRLGLGAMLFGSWGNPDVDDCVAITHAALDAGINLVDTADVYDDGRSEEIVGRALAGGRRDAVVLATKVFNPMGPGPNQQGASARWVKAAVEASLRRLGTDWIDLYQMHRPDPDTDLDDTLAALSDLVHEGKIRYFGTSTFPAEAILDAQWEAERRRRERPRTEQPPYSILARGIEQDVLPACRRFGLGVLVWSPLNGGWLTGKYRRGEAAPAGSRADQNPDHFDHGGPAHEAKLEAVEALEEIAADEGVPLARLALAWATEHPAVTSALVGPKRLDQLEGLVAAGDLRLSVEALDRIDEVVAPGTDLNPNDRGWTPPGLEVGERRRPR
jgi:aryl-alcohol dehydrogenase-like predicted oxidoreductase